MNDKILGIIYIIVGIMILVMKYWIPQFFDYLIWLVAIVLLIMGIYLFFIKKY